MSVFFQASFSRRRNFVQSLLNVCPSFSSTAFSDPLVFSVIYSLAFSRPIVFCPPFSGLAFSASPLWVLYAHILRCFESVWICRGLVVQLVAVNLSEGIHNAFLPARRYASAGTSYGPVSDCLSARVCVCLSQVGVLSKRLNKSDFFSWELLLIYTTLAMVLPLEVCSKLWTKKISPQHIERQSVL